MQLGQRGSYGGWLPDESRYNWYFDNAMGLVVQYWKELDSEDSRKTGNWSILDGVGIYHDVLRADVRTIRVYQVVTVEVLRFLLAPKS